MPSTRVLADPAGAGSGCAGTGAVDLVGDLLRVLDALTDADVSGLVDGSSVLGVLQGLSRLEAVACRQAAAFDVGGEWAAVGAKSSPAWVTTQTRGQRRRARRRLRLGKWLPVMDTTRAAFETGQIGMDHVEVLVRARDNRHTATAFGRDEALLVEWASTLAFDQFKALLHEWSIHVDPDGAETRAERDYDQRRVHLSQSLDDRWFLDAVLDPVSGEIVNTVLAGIERELFEADWAAAKERLGHQPTVDDLDRRGPQRRADALVEMARRAAAMPAGARQPKPLFTILVGEQTFARTCVLASGTAITPGTAGRWLTDSIIERITYDAPDRVIAVSQRRLFTGAMRRAIEVRDRTCTHPWCDEPVERCEADHIHPWAHGGPTSTDNGRLRCKFHNRPTTNRAGDTSQPSTNRAAATGT